MITMDELRKCANNDGDPRYARMLRELADEIDRLRARVAEPEAEIGDLVQFRDQLLADRDVGRAREERLEARVAELERGPAAIVCVWDGEDGRIHAFERFEDGQYFVQSGRDAREYTCYTAEDWTWHPKEAGRG